MGKYMFHATYTQSGLTGLLKEGGTRRREALTQTIEGMGGSVEVLYYAFGEPDLYIIADLPDDRHGIGRVPDDRRRRRPQHRHHRARDTRNRGRGHRQKRALPTPGSLRGIKDKPADLYRRQSVCISCSRTQKGINY